MKNYLLILLLLSSTSAFAALNKWIDANGQVQYSDGPPPANIKAKTIHSDSAATQSASSVPDTSKSNTKSVVDADNTTAAKAAQQAKEKADKERCAATQQNLRTLQDGIRIVEVDAKGERSFLDDAQRQQRITKAQQDIGTYCK